MLHLQGVTCGDEPLIDEKNEEQLVHGLAPLLLDMLRRNRRLVAFLLEP